MTIRDDHRIAIRRHASPTGAWEMFERLPHPALRPHVLRGYEGFTETSAATLTRLQVPHPGVVVIVNFGAPYNVLDPRTPGAGHGIGSFIAGVHDSYVHVAALGDAACVQLNLSPLGCWRLFGVAQHEVANRVVALDAFAGPAAATLADAMHSASAWEERFTLFDNFLLACLARGRAIAPAVACAWDTLRATNGNVSIASLATASQCSRKHLAERFHEQVGVPPKTLARILRFEHVVERIVASGGRRLSQHAHASGYFDHAHFDRDFRDFTGMTPREYLAMRVPAYLGAVLMPE